jgi:hypothetical protein
VSFQVQLRDDLPAETLILVGKIAVAFGQLEYTLALALKRERRLSLSEGITAAERIISRPSLIAAISEARAIRLMDQAKEASMDEILSQVEYVNGRRNALLHGCWVYFPDGTLRHRPPRGEWTPRNDRELIAHLHDIRIVRRNLAWVAGEAPDGVTLDHG